MGLFPSFKFSRAGFVLYFCFAETTFRAVMLLLFVGLLSHCCCVNFGFWWLFSWLLRASDFVILLQLLLPATLCSPHCILVIFAAIIAVF